MTDRNRFLVAYDIRKNVRLRATHKIVSGFGDPLQYSVFVCDLSPIEKFTLRAELSDVVNMAVDSVVFIDLGPASGRGVDCIEFMGARLPLPLDGTSTII